MLSAFIMVVLGMLIIWFSEKRMEIMLRLWLGIGSRLFQYTVFHSDENSLGLYGLTFTNDELWHEKLLKDLNDIAEKQAHQEGK